MKEWARVQVALAEIVLSAGLERADGYLSVAGAREHHDRDGVRLSHTPHGVDARAVGEVEIEQHDVHRLLPEPVDTLFEGHRSLQDEVIERSQLAL
jgi:hypothetical protein